MVDDSVEYSRRKADPGADFVRQAETLVRSLAGVVDASIHASGDSIEAVRVVARDDDAAGAMARNVRSALLAGLATPVVPARIHVRVAREQDDGRQAETRTGPDRDAALTHAIPPRPRISLLNPDDGDDASPVTHPASVAAPDEHDTAAFAFETIDDTVRRRVASSSLERARLVAVDVRRPGDGRVICTVSVPWNAQLYRADALAVDLPGAAAQAAAQAAVRALVLAGFDGLELNGLRETEIAGRGYVLVALRRVGPDVRHRAGSACIIGSPERSAAEAAVHAANELV